jgi:hypothetical protein
MRQYFIRVGNWYFKNERRLASLALICGFTFDIFTLKRVDRLYENVWVGCLLLIAALGIFIINLYEEGKLQEKVPGRVHFWATIIIQFAFGGSFSAFLIFYTKSGSIFSSWPFLLLLLITLFANEQLRSRYARLVFQISQLFFALLFYSIYIVPIVVGNISSRVFILSGIISLIIIVAFILLLTVFTPNRIKKEKFALAISIPLIFIIINVLYFTHVIPPIPLSLKKADVYHSIARNRNVYIATEEEQRSRFWKYFSKKVTIHLVPGQTLYAYSAVFAPAKFSTGIVHRWQYYNDDEDKWVTSSLIPLNITGGRDGGFRTYSSKTNLNPGKWLVNVETAEAQVIGRIRFDIIRVERNVELKTVEII